MCKWRPQRTHSFNIRDLVVDVPEFMLLVVIGLVELRDIMLLSLHSERSKTIELLWPTNAQMKEIVEFGPQVSSWVNTIHNAQNAILASLLVIPSMRSYEDLKKALDQVEICYEEAARSDHLLMVRHFVV